ncbi:hypothetical protein EalM132_00092 [Exiguobacterium phage vB_EalM-132]|nr:hypothetical protein EalM132_00092 [Exiguobacterium phage vB_EalM-132]
MDKHIVNQWILTRGLINLSPGQYAKIVDFFMKEDNLKAEQITAEYLLQKVKDIKCKALKIKCEETIEGGFTSTNGNYYRTNRDDQLNMVGQKDYLKDFPDHLVYWKTENAGYVAHEPADWLKHVYAEGFAHKQRTLFRYDYLKSVVNKATDSTQVIQVEW